MKMWHVKSRCIPYCLACTGSRETLFVDLVVFLSVHYRVTEIEVSTNFKKKEEDNKIVSDTSGPVAPEIRVKSSSR